MSMRDIDRLKVIQAIVDGQLKASTGANRLQLTKRQINRLVQRYRADGAAGWYHGSAANPDAGSFPTAWPISRWQSSGIGILVLDQRWHARNCASGMALC